MAGVYNGGGAQGTGGPIGPAGMHAFGSMSHPNPRPTQQRGSPQSTSLPQALQSYQPQSSNGFDLGKLFAINSAPQQAPMQGGGSYHSGGDYIGGPPQAPQLPASFTQSQPAGGLSAQNELPWALGGGYSNTPQYDQQGNYIGGVSRLGGGNAFNTQTGGQPTGQFGYGGWNVMH